MWISSCHAILLIGSGLGESLVGKNVGFLGLGRIGLAIAKRLKPFGIGKVYYTNRTDNKEAERAHGLGLDSAAGKIF